MDKPFGLRAEIKEWSRKCYGGYMNMCRENYVKPIPYHKFSDYIEKGMTTKEIFNEVHKKS